MDMDYADMLTRSSIQTESLILVVPSFTSVLTVSAMTFRHIFKHVSASCRSACA